MLKAVAPPVVSAALLAITMTGAFLDAAHGREANPFMSGSLDLSVTPASSFSFDGMAPGDRAVAPLTVTNDGTLPFRYAVTSIATNPDSKSLAGQLDLTIKTRVAACSEGGFVTDGTVLYGPADLGAVTGIDVIGDAVPGNQGGDRILDAGSSEALCIRVALPSSTGDAFQGASTSVTLTFNAEPVANS